MAMTRFSTARNSRRGAEPPVPRLLIWVSLALIAVSVPLVVNLMTRSVNETRTLNEVLRMREVVRKAETRRDQVKGALAYAATDAFTETYARAYLRWARPGDTVVVPAVAPPARQWWEEFVK